MSMRLFLAILFGLLIGGAAALTLLVAPMQPQGTAVTSGKAAIGGPFTLTDHTGKRVTEKDFAGRLLLVYFGFTNCPDICPSGLQVISAALDKLGPQSEKVTPVFISVDPERDSVSVLGEYVKSFHPRIVGLTGSAEDVRGAAKAFRVYYKKVEDEQNPTRYSVDHTSFMYLMDANGEFLQHFPHTVTVDKLAEGISKHL